MPVNSSRQEMFDAHVWRGFRRVEGNLRIGVVVSDVPDAWIAAVIEDLRSEPAFLVETAPSLDGFRGDLDVLVVLVRNMPPADCFGRARLGVWRFWLGGTDQPQDRPPYWREVYEQKQVSRISLLRHNANWEEACLLDEHVSATVQGWRPSRNAVEPLAMAGPMLVRRLLDALMKPDALPGARITLPTNPAQDRRTPAELLRFGIRQMRRSVVLRAEARGRRPQWFTALAREGRFEEVPMPPGHEYADPFLVEHDARTWLFVEDVPPGAGRARLSCLEVLGRGNFGTPFVVLERPYHLSYPCVFRHGDAFFMIPESGANRTVELYRAVEFPFTWTLEKVLLQGVEAKDTTPFFHDGVWYFFTTLNRAGMETFLFCAESLTGEWRYHPANPVCSDIRRARGAGALFYHGSQLLRPAQACAVRYGYAVVFNEVTRLTPEEYEECPVETLLPEWSEGLLGTHTWNRVGGIEAVDGLRYVK